MNVTTENESKTQSLRKAICGKTAFDTAPDKVTIEDVQKVWPLLAGCGMGAYNVMLCANRDEIQQETYARLMDKLNSYLRVD